jgi:nucleoside-diphosphate-sugar epimerase
MAGAEFSAATLPKRVFITGGTGFVGRHTAEHLVTAGCRVVMLTRDKRRVPSALENRAQIVEGDLADGAVSLDQLRGCDAVVHCAKSNHPDPTRRADADIAGTRRLLDRAVAAGVRRFVYLSSISAYGATPNATVDESFPRLAPADLYGRTKLRLEAEAFAKAGAMEVVVLQLANVYGPGQCWWGQGLLDLMRRGKVIVVNNGEGIANMVHVLDVVRAIRNTLTIPAITPGPFLITDGQPIQWREYYSALERIVGRKATLSVPAMEARNLCRSLRSRSLPARTRRWLTRTLLGSPVVFPLSDEAINAFCRKTIFSIAKARAALGYSPVYDLAAGLETLSAGK